MWRAKPANPDSNRDYHPQSRQDRSCRHQFIPGLEPKRRTGPLPIVIGTALAVEPIPISSGFKELPDSLRLRCANPDIIGKKRAQSDAPKRSTSLGPKHPNLTFTLTPSP